MSLDNKILSFSGVTRKCLMDKMNFELSLKEELGFHKNQCKAFQKIIGICKGPEPGKYIA